MCYCVSDIVDILSAFRERLMCSVKNEECCVAFVMKYLTESCYLRKLDSWCNDLWNEYLGNRLTFVFSPDLILCG